VWDVWTEERSAQWGGGLRDVIRLVWEIDELGADGQPFTVSQKYTASLHEKSRLRHDLESWRGRKFTTEELKGFDVENVLGANCQINVVHATKEGKTYANIASIVPQAKGQARMAVSKTYVRKKDRKEETKGREPGQDEEDDSAGPPF
jgi:hypothetical protein